jgi:FKBP-type peptidyl-prolyl cis-trans isomerase
MTEFNVPARPLFLVFAALAVSLLPIVPAMTRETSPSPVEQESGRNKENRKHARTRTESGLEYWDVIEGKGEPPKAGQTCVVHYTGWLCEKGAKGKQFDTSKEGDHSEVDRGAPYTFHVGTGEVIKGWDEGVSSMRAGGKRELLIPANLAFGEHGAGGVIPPNADVLYEVELLEIWKRTDSGLEYVDEREGTGAEPSTGQTCVIHYTVWLWRGNAKGKKIDSSVDRDEPFSFSLGHSEVLKGRDEGVATMRVGGKRKLLIPAELGYGDAGKGNEIPPKTTLFFVVELLKVK